MLSIIVVVTEVHNNNKKKKKEGKKKYFIVITSGKLICQLLKPTEFFFKCSHHLRYVSLEKCYKNLYISEKFKLDTFILCMYIIDEKIII